jgi:hypothetical protein
MSRARALHTVYDLVNYEGGKVANYLELADRTI